MSAFIVGYETINKILSGLDKHKELGRYLNQDPYFIDSKHMNKLGKALLKMNIKAVNQRYTEKTDFSFTKKYCFEHLSVNDFEFLKALNCFHYQCSEGKIPKTKLYKQVEEVSNSLMYKIVSHMPEYNKAKWG